MYCQPSRHSHHLQSQSQSQLLRLLPSAFLQGTFSEVRRGLCIGDGPGDGRLRAIKVVNRNKFNSFQMLRNSHLSMVDEAKLLTSFSAWATWATFWIMGKEWALLAE